MRRNPMPTPSEVYDRAIEETAPQIMTALASGQRRIQIQRPNAARILAALLDQGWSGTIEAGEAAHLAVLVLVAPGDTPAESQA